MRNSCRLLPDRALLYAPETPTAPCVKLICVFDGFIATGFLQCGFVFIVNDKGHYHSRCSDPTSKNEQLHSTNPLEESFDVVVPISKQTISGDH